MPEPAFDIPRAHRWFAVECNNEGWDIVEGADRSPEAIERMMHLAHAACFHWSAVGTQLNRQRALDLLAHTYAIAGHGAIALSFAQQALELSEQNAAEQTLFDRAQAFGTMSLALRATGQAKEADVWKHKALAAAETLNAEEQEAIRRLATPAV